MGYYIKLGDEIKGESLEAKHKEWIEIDNFSYSVNQSVSMTKGSGLSSGTADFGAISFSHLVDKTSPLLLQFCASGKTIPEVIVEALSSGGEPFTYFKLTLKNAIISSVSPGGAGGDSRLTEGVSIAYEAVILEYTELLTNGKAGKTVTSRWNIKSNNTSV
jgi:type VI secretion system secreted protein Hcp